MECSPEGRQLFENFLEKVCQERSSDGRQGKAICMAKRLRKVGLGGTSDLEFFVGGYPLVMTHIDIENGHG